jgi:hypothetical protein
MDIRVEQIDPKTWGLYVNGHLLGTSKTECDARFHMYQLQKAVDNKNVET